MGKKNPTHTIQCICLPLVILQDNQTTICESSYAYMILTRQGKPILQVSYPFTFSAYELKET
jgi:hypothetical protein